LLETRETRCTKEARAAPTPNRVYRPEPSASHLFCQSALTDLRNFADEVAKIPQVRLAVFNEALRGSRVSGGTEAAETSKRLVRRAVSPLKSADCSGVASMSLNKIINSLTWPVLALGVILVAPARVLAHCD
jgi:hypothetical protein